MSPGGQELAAAGAILTTKNTFGNDPHSRVNGNAATGVATNGDASRGGTGMNLFADPDAVFRSFRPVLLSQDTRVSGYFLRVRAAGAWT